MPRTIKNCFYKKLTFDNLLAAHLRARDQKTTKKDKKFQKDYSAATKRYVVPEVFRESGAPKAQKH